MILQILQLMQHGHPAKDIIKYTNINSTVQIGMVFQKLGVYVRDETVREKVWLFFTKKRTNWIFHDCDSGDLLTLQDVVVRQNNPFPTWYKTNNLKST